MRRTTLAVLTAIVLVLSAAPSGATTAGSTDFGEVSPYIVASAEAMSPTAEITPYIVGGHPVGLEAWPSMAALIVEYPEGLAFECGGTLIRADLVVTAAHCTQPYLGQVSRLSVLVGRANLDSLDGEFIDVAAVIQHPAFVAEPNIGFDLALLKLAEPSLRPTTPFTTLTDEPDWNVHSNVTVVGFGRTGGDAESIDGLLRQVAFTLYSDTHCGGVHSFQVGWDLCGGTSACHGDSGGPLITTVGGPRLAGVVSRGSAMCNAEAIFTRIAPFADWIVTSSQSAETSRRSGSDRYLTAANLAAEFASGVPVVYLVTGEGFPDAVTAAAAAGVGGGPVLLAQRDSLPSATRDQLARLAPQRLVVVGGPSAISDAVATIAGSVAGVPATRIAGPDRYQTAAAVATDAYPTGAETVYIAVGTSFPDAVASGAVAGGEGGGPVLLTEQNSLPAAAAAELTRLDPTKVVILGGTGAVSSSVQASIAGSAPRAVVQRISGSDRYATAAALSAASFSPGVPVVYIATGRAFPDALASGPLAVADDAPVLLVDGATIPASVAAEVLRLRPDRIVVLGGTAAVPARTAWLLDGLIVR